MSRAKNRWALIVSTTAGLFAAAYADAAIATADLSSPGNLCADVAQLASVVGPGVEQSLPGAASALADSPAGPILGAGLAGAAGAVPTRDALLSPTGLAALPTSPITSLAPATAPITQEAGVVGPAAVGDVPAGGGVAAAPITQEAGVVGPAAVGDVPAGGGVAAAPITQEAGVVGPAAVGGAPAGGGVAAAPITQEAGVVGPAAVGGAPAGGRAPMAGSPLESLPMLADSPLPLLGGMPLADLLCCP